MRRARVFIASRPVEYRVLALSRAGVVCVASRFNRWLVLRFGHDVDLVWLHFSLTLLWLHLAATAVSCVVSCLLTVVALQSFSLLTLGLVVALPLSSTPSLVPGMLLGVVDFHGVRITTLLTSGPAVGSIARSSVILIVVAFLHGSFVEFVVDLNRRLRQV